MTSHVPANTPTSPERAEDQKRVGADLAAYEIYVAEMAKKADGTVILNHSRAHAEVVLAQIFKSAQNDVRILTGHLDNEVYGTERVRSAAKLFARKNDKARIKIVSESEVVSNDFVNDLQPVFGDRLTVCTLKKDISTRAHFAVADNVHFRLEADKEKSEAVVMFGNESTASRLVSIFDSLLALSC